MSFWSELKRRSVFRAGTAYAVVAWLLIQIADVILPVFELPPTVFRGFLFLVAIGFLITVVLAWLYDVTPDGVKRADAVSDDMRLPLSQRRKIDFAIIALLGVTVAFLLSKDYIASLTAPFTDVEARSLAVLAFTNRSADQEDSYFADGLADELLSTLSRIEELRVAPRTSSFYFKGKDVDIATIASTLNVGSVLSGSVQRDGGSLRVTVALDGAETGELLWSESYDRDIGSLLDIQRDIALSVASAIVPILSPASQSIIAAVPTENDEAYDFYLRGRSYLRLPAEESTIASAQELFDRAISLDPRFAGAYAGRCEALTSRYELFRTSESFEAAEGACHRALTLDNSSWEPRVALAGLYRFTGQFDDAIRELQNAISTQPTAVDLLVALGQTYSDKGDYEQAEVTLLRAESLDSSDWRVHNQLGHVYYDSPFAGMEQAIERYRRVIQLTPDSGIGYDNLGNAYLAQEQLAEAEEAFNASPLPSRWTYENRGLVYYYRGEFEKAIEDHTRALELAPDYYKEWGNLGDAYRFTPGNEENARNAYERAIELAERELAIDPDNLEAVGRLSSYHAYIGQTSDAERYIQRVVEQPQPVADFLVSLASFFAARTMIELGDTESAYEYLQRALNAGFAKGTLFLDPDVAAAFDDAQLELL